MMFRSHNNVEYNNGILIKYMMKRDSKIQTRQCWTMSPKLFQFGNKIIQIIFNIEKMEVWRIVKFKVKNTNFQVNQQDKSS